MKRLKNAVWLTTAKMSVLFCSVAVEANFGTQEEFQKSVFEEPPSEIVLRKENLEKLEAKIKEADELCIESQSRMAHSIKDAVSRGQDPISARATVIETTSRALTELTSEIIAMLNANVSSEFVSRVSRHRELLAETCPNLLSSRTVISEQVSPVKVSK